MASTATDMVGMGSTKVGGIGRDTTVMVTTNLGLIQMALTVPDLIKTDMTMMGMIKITPSLRIWS